MQQRGPVVYNTNGTPTTSNALISLCYGVCQSRGARLVLRNVRVLTQHDEEPFLKC
jgi:hypothetical protein